MNNVRVRIAPSPTGIPHIGTTRTALFNYLFAKHNNGKFILRIEDTDRARLVPESEKAIREILEWLGLNFDEEYVQSKRLKIYKEHAKVLLEKKLAYEDNGALRFKMPKTGKTAWTDAIGNKEISFENNTQEDFVILKSDGYPTYNFANVVDDHLMEITHVIRGDEFISSTPKHLQLYSAFGWKPPVFAHMPVILGPDHQKLSKRHGAKSALEYRDEGYLSEALLNYMALLGWNPGGDREIMTVSEMIELFDLKDVNMASPVFDSKKLEWFNGVYIRKAPDDKLASLLLEYTRKKYPSDKIKRTVPLVKERMRKLSEFTTLAGFLLEDKSPEPIRISPYYPRNVSGATISIMENLPKSQWNSDNLNKAFGAAIQNAGTTPKDFFMDIRGTVAGSPITPPITESIEILGKEETIKRLKKGYQTISAKEIKK